MKTPYFKFALKGALVSLLALFIAHLLKVQQDYWVLFGAVTVLKFNIGASFQRGKERLLGTFSGVLASLVLANIFLHWPLGVYFLIPICIFFGIYYLYHYFISMFFMTLIFVLVIGVMSAHPVNFAIARIGDTLIGVIIAALVSLFIWPRSAGETFNSELNSYLQALKDKNLKEIDALYTKLETNLRLLDHEPGKKLWNADDREALIQTLDRLRAIVRVMVYLSDKTSQQEGESAYLQIEQEYLQEIKQLQALANKNTAAINMPAI